MQLAVGLEVADEGAVDPVQLRAKSFGGDARGGPAGARGVPGSRAQPALELTDLRVPGGAAAVADGRVVALAVDDAPQLGEQGGHLRVLGRADLADPPRDRPAAFDGGEDAERLALDEREVDVELDQPGAVHGTGGLQVDAAELRLVCGQLAQPGPQVPVRGPPPAVLDGEQSVDVPGVQPRRDGVGGVRGPGLLGELRGGVGAAQPLVELGREQRGCPGLRLETVGRELVREALRRKDQARRRPASAQVGLDEDQLAGAAPAGVAVASEPVAGATREASSLLGVAAEQRHLGAGQLDLADVLPGPVPAQLPGGAGQGLVRLRVQAGGQEHPRAVEEGDPDLGVLVHHDALVDDPERERQVAGEELQAAEVVQGDPLEPLLAEPAGDLDGGGRGRPGRGRGCPSPRAGRPG